MRYVGIAAFAGNEITEVYLPDNLSALQYNVFANNKINKVKLGNNLEMISTYAFLDNLLTTVEITENVTLIQLLAFYSNPNLTKIINKTGNSFDWGYILFGDESLGCTFETGICKNIEITN